MHPKLNVQQACKLISSFMRQSVVHKYTMADYLICIDFEATCYPSRAQRNKGWYQEIIDFGAVFIDLSDGDIISEFQSYVSPTEFYLTRGCYKKLGIESETLDNASTLPTALNEFGRWMKLIRDDHGLVMPWHNRSSDENAYFCTWSNMDLGYYLPNECSYKNLTYANYLKWWLNGQEVYEDAFGRAAKLHDAADMMGTTIVGDAHDAVDDAKTLAFLMHELWNENGSFDFDVKDCFE